MFGRRRSKVHIPSPYGVADLDDYERFNTLCTVWPKGPQAQAYMQEREVSKAHAAAREVKFTIAASQLSWSTINRDHMELLARIEATPLEILEDFACSSRFEVRSPRCERGMDQTAE